MSGAGGRQTGEGEGPAETLGGSAPDQGHSHALTLDPGGCSGLGGLDGRGPGSSPGPNHSLTPSHSSQLGGPHSQAQCQALRPPPIGSL